LSIVEDIFEIALIETGEVNLVKEKVNLVSLLNEINESIIVEQQNTDKVHIELKLTIPKGSKEISVNTDPLKFKQILINLLKNALKFTIKGTVEYGFNVKQNHDKSFLEFFVKDTGIGIPKQKKEIIFEMFRQIEETHSRTFGGIGLGLTIAKRLTEILGGKMWLDTDEQTGSIFYFTIPFNDFYPEGKHANLKIQACSDGKKEKVLIVEDDALSLSFLKILLKKSGINTICVKSGKDAILACKNDPDIKLVLMDINMPRMDGYEATTKIKEMCPDLPVIAQTAYAIPGDREKLSQAGCDDYISKPINKKILMDKIKKYFK
jgi:CheY-like chemotaxis protein